MTTKKTGKAAEVSELSDLHKALTKFFSDRLASGEVTASEANVIRQFLKDNNIEAVKDNPQTASLAAAFFPYTGENDDADHIN